MFGRVVCSGLVGCVRSVFCGSAVAVDSLRPLSLLRFVFCSVAMFHTRRGLIHKGVQSLLCRCVACPQACGMADVGQFGELSIVGKPIIVKYNIYISINGYNPSGVDRAEFGQKS